MNDEREWESLREQVEELRSTQATILRRLNALEKQLGPANVEPAALEPSVMEPTRAAQREPKANLETELGLNWVNRIGAITLVLGVAFFFKYAIESQWIGETVRVLLGVMAGLGALAAGEFFWRGNQKVFAQGITGTGAAVLYLSIYAAFDFYHLIPQPLAFLLLTLVTGSAAALAFRYDAVAILALGMLGGFAAPLLLSTGEDRPWFLFSYVLLLDLGVLAVARVRHWRWIGALAFAGTFFLYQVWLLTGRHVDEWLPATTFLIVFYVLFASTGSRLLLSLSHVAAVMNTALIWTSKPSGYLPLAWGITAASLVLATIHSWPETVLVIAVSYYPSFWLWHEAGRVELAPALLVLTGGFLILFAGLRTGARIGKRNLTAAEYAATILNSCSFFGSSYYLLRQDYNAYVGAFTLALAGIHLAAGWTLRNAGQERKSSGVLLYAGLFVAFLTLAVPIQFAGATITTVWAMEAAGLAWVARNRETPRVFPFALALFALTFLRLQFVDFWMFTTPGAHALLGNRRFLTGVAAAVSFWLGARWSSQPALLIAGHYLMLWTIGLEVRDWAARVATPGNVVSFESASFSIMAAAYAVVLIGIGVGRRNPRERLLGLVLLGAVVLKLYLYDVWLLGRVYRITAFAGLGALLLLASFLYSRYRESLSEWLKPSGASAARPQQPPE